MEQAHDPPQAPKAKVRFSAGYADDKLGRPTLHFQIVLLGNIKEIVALGHLEIMLLPFFINKGDFQPRLKVVSVAFMDSSLQSRSMLND